MCLHGVLSCISLGFIGDMSRFYLVLLASGSRLMSIDLNITINFLCGENDWNGNNPFRDRFRQERENNGMVSSAAPLIWLSQHLSPLPDMFGNLRRAQAQITTNPEMRNSNLQRNALIDKRRSRRQTQGGNRRSHRGKINPIS